MEKMLITIFLFAFTSLVPLTGKLSALNDKVPFFITKKVIHISGLQSFFKKQMKFSTSEVQSEAPPYINKKSLEIKKINLSAINLKLEKAVKPAADILIKEIAPLSRFNKYKSAHSELAKFWPTQKLNPIAKKQKNIKVKKISQIKLFKLAKVKKSLPSDLLEKVKLANLDDSVFVNNVENVESNAQENNLIPVAQLKRIVSLVDPSEKIMLGYSSVANPIRTLSLDVENFDRVKFEKNLAFMKEDENVNKIVKAYKKDKISLGQSGIVKNVDKRNPVKGKNPEPEMLFLDYSKEKKKIVVDSKKLVTSKSTPLAKSIISDSVRKVIQREMGKSTPKVSVVASASKVLPTGFQGMEFASFIKRSNKEKQIKLNLKKPVVRSGKNLLTISPKIFNLQSGKANSLYEFDIVPSYDLNEVFPDTGEGKVSIEYSLKSGKGLFHGTLIHRDIVRMNFDLAILDTRNEYSIPVFEIDSFNKFVDKNNVSVPGGYVLIEYSENVDSADIEEYTKVIHLDEDFKVIESTIENEDVDNEKKSKNKNKKSTKAKKSSNKNVDKLPSYSLFVGVPGGNTILRTLNRNGDISEKIIFIFEDELTYSQTELGNSKKVKFDLHEDGLLGQKQRLNISEEKIKYFNLPITSKKKALNSYEMEAPPLLDGMRRYLEISHTNDFFIIGSQNGGDLTLPSAETVDFYFDRVNLRNLENACIVQINTKSPIEDIHVEGHTARGNMLIDTHFLTSTGSLLNEVDGIVRKVFVTGDYQGSLFFKIKYKNGKSELSRTYCSPGAYVIENF